MDDERLVVALEARIRDFERNMAKAERTGTKSYNGLQQRSQRATRAMERDMTRSTSRINQALSTTTGRIGAMGKAFAAGAVVAGLGAITRGATQAIRSMADLGREAERAGVSVQAFQELSFVAEQNRIGVDQLTDGLKELQLRADEFIETGAGPAAEALTRLGYDARDLSRQLEHPEELFLDLIHRMEDLDRAAQIRVADEVFGGQAGERFVELLDEGEAGIRQMIGRAHELGAVMDDEAIARAEELDRKFAEVGQRVSTLSKQIVVGIADAIDAISIDPDRIFGSAERAAAALGEETYTALKRGTDATDEQREAAEDLVSTYERLFNAIEDASGGTGSLNMIGVQDVETARSLADILAQLDQEMVALANGEQEAEAFENKVGDLVGEAQNLIAELGSVDQARFTNVISNINGVAAALASARAESERLRSDLPGSEPMRIEATEPRQPYDMPPSPYTMDDSQRPQARPNAIDALYFPDAGEEASSGRSPGGGGRPQVSDYQREIERTRADIAKLEAEATELAAIAETGREYGDALEYARKRAELLYEAENSGRAITPELKAEIDNLALSYTRAGQQAETAADRMRLIEENAERGADRMGDFFGSILSGSMSAEDALKGLLGELAKAQIRSGFLGMVGDTASGPLGWLGNALSGGRATGGPVRGGSAYMVNERTPRSEVFVPSQSGGVLNVPQAQAALSESTGGGGQSVTVNFAPQIDARGADSEAMARVRDQMDRLQRDIPNQVRQTIRKDRNQGRR